MAKKSSKSTAPVEDVVVETTVETVVKKKEEVVKKPVQNGYPSRDFHSPLK